MIQLPNMALVDSPRFTAMEQCGEDYGLIDLQYGLQDDASSVPDILVESAEGSTGFG